MEALRVDVDELRQLATQVDSLADDLCAAEMTASSGASWQASVQSAVDAHGQVAAARAAFADRMRSTSHKLAAAAAAYEGLDDGSAAKLRDVVAPTT